MKILEGFENKVVLRSREFQAMMECLPDTNTMVESLKTGLHTDALALDIHQLPMTRKTLLEVIYFNVKMCELCISYSVYHLNYEEDIRRILSIPL